MTQGKDAPPYQRIAQHYRDLIRSGELREGDRLPTTRDLMATWDVAAATANRVVATLRDEGLVVTHAGRAGTTVAALPEDRQEVLVTDHVAAPTDVARDLGVRPGATVERRRWVTYEADAVVAVTTEYRRLAARAS